MKRPAFLAGSAAATLLSSGSRAAFAVADTTYSVQITTGSLIGTALLPDPARGTAKRVSAVLIVAGSGPTDRDGNAGTVLRTDSYRLLAEALRGNGIASVRYDKRGVGASAAALHDEAEVHFDDLVADVVAWVKKMRADLRFGKICIAGHSEGSTIGMIAAQTTGADAFVSLEGPGFPAAGTLRRQLADALATAPQLLEQSNAIIDSLVAGKPVSDVPAALAPLYRPSVQPYLISWFRRDPRVEVAKLACPVAIVQGTADLQVTVDDAKALLAALPPARAFTIDGLTHPLKHTSDPSPANQKATVYVDPTIPIDPGVPAAIAAMFA
jgi:alpha-beta hydrolase superfamily lysophospholipase